MCGSSIVWLFRFFFMCACFIDKHNEYFTKIHFFSTFSHHRDNNNFKSVRFFFAIQFLHINSIKNPKSFIENPSKSKMILFNKQNRYGIAGEAVKEKTKKKKENSVDVLRSNFSPYIANHRINFRHFYHAFSYFYL